MEEEKIIKKVKLIYTAELLIFVAVAAVLSVLFFIEVLPASLAKARIFSVVTTVGFGYLVFDLIWSIMSPKHRKSAPIIDKCLTLPLALFFIGFDIYIYINNWGDTINFVLFRYVLGGIFAYVAAIYTFQAIYHYKYPLPSLIESSLKAAEEAKAIEAEEAILREKEEAAKQEEVVEEVVEEVIEDNKKE